MVPRWLQEVSKILQDGSKRSPKTAQDGSKTAQDTPKTFLYRPKTAQEGSMMVPRCSKMAPRGFQDTPRWLQEDSKILLDGSRRPYDSPETLLRRLQRAGSSKMPTELALKRKLKVVRKARARHVKTISLFQRNRLLERSRRALK